MFFEFKRVNDGATVLIRASEIAVVSFSNHRVSIWLSGDESNGGVEVQCTEAQFRAMLSADMVPTLGVDLNFT